MTQSDEDLYRRLVWRLTKPDPRIPSEVDGDLSCFFCGKAALGSPLEPSRAEDHEPNCPWLTAMEIKNDEHEKLADKVRDDLRSFCEAEANGKLIEDAEWSWHVVSHTIEPIAADALGFYRKNGIRKFIGESGFQEVERDGHDTVEISIDGKKHRFHLSPIKQPPSKAAMASGKKWHLPSDRLD